MKYRIVESMLNLIIFMLYFGRISQIYIQTQHHLYIQETHMDTSRIYQRNTYRHPIAYMLEKYIQYHIYVREAHTDTATHILHNIY